MDGPAASAQAVQHGVQLEASQISMQQQILTRLGEVRVYEIM